MVISVSFTVFLLFAMKAVCHGDYSLFNYDDDTDKGPSRWLDLEIQGNQCGGRKNSPIALDATECTVFFDYQFDNGDCGIDSLKFKQSEGGLSATYKEKCTNRPQMTIHGSDEIFTAVTFEIHTSSEHSIDGEFFDAELHIVHGTPNSDRLAILGLMIEASAQTDNPVIDRFLDEWILDFEKKVARCSSKGVDVPSCNYRRSTRTTLRKNTREPRPFRIYDMIPEGSSFYRYDGGLTTPPCSEVVWWNLADKPIQVSVQQYLKLTRLILENVSSCSTYTIASPSGVTSRPVQPLNERTVDRVCPCAFASGGCAQQYPELPFVPVP